jgi:hypothetical protein
MNLIDHIKGIAVTGNVLCLIYYTFMLFKLAVHIVILELEVGNVIQLYVCLFCLGISSSQASILCRIFL